MEIGIGLSLTAIAQGVSTAITLASPAVSIDGSPQLATFTATSSESLVGGTFGVEFGAGAYTERQGVVGAESSQSITIDLSVFGSPTPDVIWARLYHNPDEPPETDQAANRVYTTLPAYVQLAAQSGTATEGQTLTGSNGYIIGTGVTESQKWQYDDAGSPNEWADINGATNETYVIPTTTYTGDTLRYAKGGTVASTTVWAYSAATSAVQSAMSAQAAAVINAYATPPSEARQTLIAALVDGLISDGVWSSLDSLYVTAAPAEADTLINWKNPGTNNLTKTGTVTHSADVSMTGNGTTGRLSGSVRMNDASFGFARDSAHIMVFTTGTRTNAFTCGNDDGITNTSRCLLTADNSFDSATFRINTPNSSAGKATTAATGCFLAQRTAGSVSQAYQNGASIGTADTDASDGECDGRFTLCAGYNGSSWAYSSTGIKAGSFGPSLTGGQITALYNRLNTYLGAI